jgi:hypothetical protein
MTTATTNITANITMCWKSDTAKLRYGGTKRKSRSSTLATAAAIDGPYPNRRECQRRVEVELFDDDTPMVDLATGQELQAEDERAGVEATVGLDHADDDVSLQVPLAARGLEHRVRLADPRRGAEEDDELAAARASLLGVHPAKELVGIGARLAGHGRELT